MTETKKNSSGNFLSFFLRSAVVIVFAALDALIPEQLFYFIIKKILV